MPTVIRQFDSLQYGMTEVKTWPLFLRNKGVNKPERPEKRQRVLDSYLPGCQAFVKPTVQGSSPQCPPSCSLKQVMNCCLH